MTKLLTVVELAAKLGITEAGARTRIARGYIPANLILRVGRSMRFDEAEVDAWLAARLAAVPPKPELGELLTIEQVAELLSTTESGVRGRLSRKSFPADIVVRQNGRVYFHATRTREWVESSRKEGAGK